MTQPHSGHAGVSPTAADDLETGSTASIGAIFAQLTTDFTTLMKQEVALAKAEVTQSAKQAGKGAGFGAGAGVAAHLVAFFASIALWWWIGGLLGSNGDRSLGWSAVIVAVIWAIIAAILAAMAKSSFNNVSGIRQTAETAKKIPDALKGEDH